MKKYNLMVAKPYFDKTSNQNKTQWVKIGTAIEMAGQDGHMKTFGNIDAVPTGTWWDGSYQLFEADQQNNQPQQQQGYQQQNNQQQNSQSQQPQQQQQNNYRS